MTVSSATATYQVLIATAGATVVSGNVELTLAVSDLAGVPTISGPTVDLLGARTTSHPFRVECIVDTVLFPSGSRLTELGRLIEVQRNLDGAGYGSVATGRISHASEVDRGKVVLEVSDERWVERETEIFRTTDTVQLHPPGMAVAWLDSQAAGEATYIVKEISSDAVRIGPNDEKGPADIRQVPAGLREALATDLVAREDQDGSASNSAGNFTSLRFRYSGGDHTVIGFRQRLGLAPDGVTFFGLLDELSPEASGKMLHAWVYISGHNLNVNDQITGRFYWPSGVQISEMVPRHIGGTTGVHPFELLEDILDGDYGGQAVRYDATAMQAVQDLPFKPVWARVYASAERSEWLTNNVSLAYNCPPLVGTDLNLRPTSLRLPVNLDPGTLTVLSASNASIPTWHHTSLELATVVEFQCKAARRLSNVATHVDDRPVDDYVLYDVRVDDVTHDTVATLGEKRHKIKTDLILDRARFGEVSPIVRELALELFDVFGDGAQLGEITVADNLGLEVGDYVLIDHDSLKGFNAATGDRTGDRVALLTAFRDYIPAEITFGYLDLGPGSSPLSAPTVSIAQDGTDPDLVNVTISGLGAGETATVEVTVDTTTPTEYEFVRSGVTNSTISFRVNAGSGTAYVRTYATAPHRIRSAYATDSVALSSRARIDSAEVVIDIYTATVSWQVPSTTLGVRTRYSIHDRSEDPTYGSQTDYDADDGGFSVASLSPNQMISVELTPYTGWTGSAVSGTAGEVVTVRAVFPRSTGGIDLRGVRFVPSMIETTFDANGEAVVSATGDEDVANMYVTVGDGSAPSDPTAGVNDGTISGRTGSVSTGVKITTGNTAIVKVVSEDAGGNLGPVITSQQARKIGPFYQDTSGTTVTGTTSETTLDTIPIAAGALGTQGGLDAVLAMLATGTSGTKTIRVKLGSTSLATIVLTAGFSAAVRLEVLLFNDGATDSQVASLVLHRNGASPTVLVSTAAEDSTGALNIAITVQLGDASDSVSLQAGYAKLLGTD